MTMEGTAEKTGILLIITTTLAIATYAFLPGLAIIGFLGGFITAMIVIFSRSTNPVLICSYAGFEGLALGGFTYFIESQVKPKNPLFVLREKIYPKEN